MKTKVEIEEGRVVIVLVPENEFEERVIEDYDNSKKEGVVEVRGRNQYMAYGQDNRIIISLRDKVQPPKANDDFPVGEKFSPPVKLTAACRKCGAFADTSVHSCFNCGYCGGVSQPYYEC